MRVREVRTHQLQQEGEWLPNHAFYIRKRIACKAVDKPNTEGRCLKTIWEFSGKSG